MQKYLYKDLYNLEEVHWWHKAKRNLVSQFINSNKNKGKKILDVGCGTGKNLEFFSKFGKVWGIDTSQEAIDFCKKRGAKNIILASIEKLPFSKEFFDIVTALDVLEHVDDLKSLKEINRVLGSSGLLIATVPAFPFLWSRWDEVLHHKRRYTKKILTKVLEETDFKVIKISYVYSFLFFPALIIRQIKEIFFKNRYPSDFKLSNIYLNFLLEKFAKYEKFFITRGGIPFGTSLVVVARKN